MYLETINEKAFRSFLSNPDISVLDGNVLDKHHNSNFYRFVRVPLSDGEHSVEALFGQMCSNYPTSMSKNHFYEQHNLEFMAYVVDHEKTYAESYEFLRLFDVTSAYTGPHSAMGEMTKTLWDYLEQKTILDPDYLNTPELQNEAYENAVKQYVLQKKDTACMPLHLRIPVIYGAGMQERNSTMPSSRNTTRRPYSSLRCLPPSQ